MSTIAQIVTDSVADSGEFSFLLRALETTGLTHAVADPNAHITVFAPTNAAFAELANSVGIETEGRSEEAIFDDLVAVLATLGDPVQLLSEVLLYHVSPGVQTVHELRAAGTIETAQSDGAVIEINGRHLIDQDPDAANPRLVEGLTDIEASNGIIQVIDGVLRPIDLPAIDIEEPAEPDQPELAAATIADLVLDTSGKKGFDKDGGDFDILREALAATGLTEAVADPDADLTVFAPTDAAFIALAQALGAEIGDKNDKGAFKAIEAALTELGGSPEGALELLEQILLYHVSPGAKTTDELMGTVQTLQGGTITVDGTTLIDADPELTDPGLVEGLTNLVTGNGTVQVIDQVLLPIDVPGGETPAEDVDAEPAPTASEVLVGDAQANALTGGEGSDRLRGKKGDDSFEGGAGDDRLKGGKGLDTAIFDGDAEDYSITRLKKSKYEITDTTGEEGTDTLKSIEILSFDDTVIDLSALPKPPKGETLSAADLALTAEPGTMAGPDMGIDSMVMTDPSDAVA